MDAELHPTVTCSGILISHNGFFQSFLATLLAAVALRMTMTVCAPVSLLGNIFYNNFDGPTKHYLPNISTV